MATAVSIRMEDEQLQSEEYLPPKPILPLPTDCCGTGCSPCVNDLYDQELAEWTELSNMGTAERRKWYQDREAGLKMSSRDRPSALSREHYRQFQIISIRQITHDSFLYSFELPENHVLGAGVGQHAILRVKDASNGELIARQYTPISALAADTFDVVIKIYEEGRASKAIKSWKVGTITEWKGPFGGYLYRPNQYSKLVMLACGTGIAPFVRIIRQVLDNEQDETQLTLLYSLKTQADILLKDILDTFQDFWNFRIKYFFSRSSLASLNADKGLVGYRDTVEFGRINENSIANELKLPSDKLNTYFLVCGTKSFVKDMTNIVLRLGLERERICIF